MNEGLDVFDQFPFGVVLQGFGRKQDHFIGEQVVARGVGHQALAAHEQTGFVAERAVFRDAKQRAVFVETIDHLGERAVRQDGRDGGPGGIFLGLFDGVSGFLFH
ncbi:MAG: hypothetical protein DMG27_21645 [Acidobacteria bacterium]|nr:MAG: hypothetical protein DMG27_21645 [Acidobacteriota bacterium]